MNRALRDAGSLARQLSFRNPWQKARWLDAAAHLDALSDTIQALAARFTAVEPEPAPLAALIHAWVRDAIAYRRDEGRFAGREELADSETILRRGFDDCDGKARLFVALCLACGLGARIRPVFEPAPNGGDPAFTHVQAEVELGEAWVLAELILWGVPLGSGSEAGTVDPATGRYKLAGPPPPA